MPQEPYFDDAEEERKQRWARFCLNNPEIVWSMLKRNHQELFQQGEYEKDDGQSIPEDVKEAEQHERENWPPPHADKMALPEGFIDKENSADKTKEAEKHKDPERQAYLDKVAEKAKARREGQIPKRQQSQDKEREQERERD